MVTLSPVRSHRHLARHDPAPRGPVPGRHDRRHVHSWQHPIAGLTRRGLLAGLGVAGLASVVGCNDQQAVTVPAGDTRSVDTANGPVQIPVDPQRVVCTDFYTTYALLDVGFTPAGTAEVTVGGVLPAQQEAYDALPKVGRTTEIDYEAVAALEPDLILGTQVPGVATDLHDQLSGIAPTVLFAASTPGDWKTRAVRAAQTVNRGPAGEELAAAYDRRVADLRQTHADALASTTWALLRATTSGVIFVDGPVSWSGVVLADLQATFSAAAPTDTVGREISLERLDLIADCDVVLHLANATGAADPSTSQVIDDPVFSRLVGPDVTTVPLSSYYAAHDLDGMAVLDQIDTVLQGR